VPICDLKSRKKNVLLNIPMAESTKKGSDLKSKICKIGVNTPILIFLHKKNVIHSVAFSYRTM
jgi:hypothetical protein